MDWSLALTALLMGVAGGPHCLAMCGAACAALGGRGAVPAAKARPVPGVGIPVVAAGPAPGAGGAASAGVGQGLWLFQLGRLVGYASLGAVAAASMQAVGWLSIQSAALRPFWTLLHAAAAVLGLLLLWQARQPVWLEEGARRMWARVRSLAGRAGASPGQPGAKAAPLVMGMAWAFLPCGLLYSALLVAALSPSSVQGAGVMALFAVGSGLSLLAGPWLWLRLQGEGSGRWAIRIAGAALLATSAWALWQGLVHDAAPWCVTPPAAGV